MITFYDYLPSQNCWVRQSFNIRGWDIKKLFSRARHEARNVAAAIGIALLYSLQSIAASSCRMPPLGDQKQDAATIDRLEEAWDSAYLTGDVDLEECILTRDFTEILRNGQVKGLQYELMIAQKNKEKMLPVLPFAKRLILIHGNVAVAYGRSTSVSASDNSSVIRSADYFIWAHGMWRAFFAEQTSVQPSANW